MWAPARTAHPAEKPASWTEVRSPHFLVVANTGEKRARQTAAEFERFRVMFAAGVPHARLDSGRPMNVLAVREESDLRTLLPEFWEAKSGARPAGVFVRGPYKDYAALRVDAPSPDSRESPYQVLYHEYAHLLIDLNLPSIPVWLGEGLAEFFAQTTMTGRETGLGGYSRSRAYQLVVGRTIPWEDLFGAGHDSPYFNERDRTSAFYAQSWALTHYLMLGDNQGHRGQLLAYLKAIDDGASSVEAARTHLGEARRLTAVLQAYLQRDSLSFVPVDAAAKVDDRQFAARALPPSEVAAVRGDFHLHRGRLPDARAALEEALHLDPRLAAAHESMGLLAWREGRTQDALASLSQATSLDSTRFLAYYLLGTLLPSAEPTSGSTARAERSLRKAIELQPGFAPAYSELARMLGAGTDRLTEALSLAKKAVELEPATLSHHLLVAQLAFHMGAVDEAERLAARVLATAYLPRDREAAQNALDEMRAARASAGGMRAPPKEVRVGAGPPPVPPPPLAHRANAPLRVEGRVVQLECGDAELLLTLDVEGRRVTLHAGNFFQVAYLTTAWKAPADFNPCTHLKGRRLRVGYGPPAGAANAGEIMSVEVLD